LIFVAVSLPFVGAIYFCLCKKKKKTDDDFKRIETTPVEVVIIPRAKSVSRKSSSSSSSKSTVDQVVHVCEERHVMKLTKTTSYASGYAICNKCREYITVD